MALLLDELGTYLQTNGIGTQGTDLFLGSLPDRPDAAVAVLEYGGLAPEHTMGANTAPDFERPRVQVLSRHADYTTARQKAEDAYRLLDKLTATSLSSTLYLRIAALQSPTWLGQDQNNRHVVSCNFQVWKELSA